MNTAHDTAVDVRGSAGASPAPPRAPVATPSSSPEKRAYDKPAVVDLGDVRELTRGGGGSKFDGLHAPGRG